MTDEHIKEDIKHINKRNQEYIAENNRMTDKQIIIKELSYLVDLGDTENEVYDNLQALLDVLRVQGIISNEAYEQAEIKVSKIWGFNTNE